MNKSSFEEVLEKDGVLIYTNEGDSMAPLIRQGRDLIIIEKTDGSRLKKHDVPLYKRDSGEYVLHRILKVRKDDYVICGDNRCCREYGISDRHIIGVLKAVIRDGKEISTDSKIYRVYVRVWCGFFFVRFILFKARGFFRRIRRFIKNI